MTCETIRRVVIAGAGLMGSSMAQTFAQYGYAVTIYNHRAETLKKAEHMIRLNQETLVKSGELSAEASANILASIGYTDQMDCFADCDVVVESIVEKLEVKKQFFAEVSAICRADAILCSNTSALPITSIGEAVKGPERFLGMHWFNPPHLIPLVEVVQGEKTDPAVAQVVYELAKQIGKQPVNVKKDAKGFIANRIQMAVLREALHIVENGIADYEDVDRVLKYAIGFRYACFGPFEVVDLGGLDTFDTVSHFLNPDLAANAGVSPLLDDRVARGELGVKSGKGFYDYSDGRDEAIIKKRDAMFIKLAKCLFEDEQ